MRITHRHGETIWCPDNIIVYYIVFAEYTNNMIISSGVAYEHAVEQYLFSLQCIIYLYVCVCVCIICAALVADRWTE